MAQLTAERWTVGCARSKGLLKSAWDLRCGPRPFVGVGQDVRQPRVNRRSDNRLTPTDAIATRPGEHPKYNRQAKDGRLVQAQFCGGDTWNPNDVLDSHSFPVAPV